MCFWQKAGGAEGVQAPARCGIACMFWSLPQRKFSALMLMSPGHACPQQSHASLGLWLHNQRISFNKSSVSAGKVAALKAVGVEFDGRKAQAIREQHEAMRSGKGKEDTDGQDEEGGPSRQEQGSRSDKQHNGIVASRSTFDRRLEELKEYNRRHGAALHVCFGRCRNCTSRERGAFIEAVVWRG
jgi:hypothetical protein